MARLVYTGPIYVRPLGRGICLLDHPAADELEDLLPDGYYRARIVIEPLSPEEQEAIKSRQIRPE